VVNRGFGLLALFALICVLLGGPLAAVVGADLLSPARPSDIEPSSVELSVASVLPPVPANDRFGLAWISSAEMSSVPDSRYQLALNTGARWNRWVMYWDSHERTKGVVDWFSWDANVQRDRAHGLNDLAILLNTPSWAATTAGLQASDVGWRENQYAGPKLAFPGGVSGAACGDGVPRSPIPQNLYAPVFNSDGSINQDNYWGYFVWRVVNRYKPGGELARRNGWSDGWGIRYWEIWNEPNFPSFWGGTVQQYYRLLKVAYQAAKAADPNAVILWGGIAHYCNSIDWPVALMNEMVADTQRTSGWPYFDVSNFHWYSQPAAIYDQTKVVKDQLASHGLGGRPMWITETNVPAYGDTVGGPFCGSNLCHPSCEGYPYSASVDEQASYVIQAYANALAAGVDRIFVHQLQDDQYGVPYPEAWGLVSNPLPSTNYQPWPRPLYTAYQVAAKYFANPQQVTRGAAKNASHVDDTRTVQVTMSNVLVDGHYHRVTVLWNLSGSSLTAYVQAAASSAQRLRKDGTVDTLLPAGGWYAVWLPPATAKFNCSDSSSGLMIGGDPRLLVEDVAGLSLPDTTPPTTSMAALPTQSDPAFTVSWSGSDGPQGSGVKNYDVQYNDVTAGTGWRDWLLATTATSARFVGISAYPTHTYQFRTRARDNAGNVGTYPATAQAWTMVRYVPPPTGLIQNGGFEGSGSLDDALSHWSVSGSVQVSPSLTHSGQSSAWLGANTSGSGSGGTATIWQSFNLPASASTARLVFYVFTTTQPTASAYFEAKVAYGGGAILIPIPSSSGSGWQRVEFDLMNAGDAHLDLRGQTLTLSFSAVGGYQAYVDDVELWPEHGWFPLVGAAR